MRSILPKGENRKRHSIAARAIACVLVALLALPFAGCSASPNATGATTGSQEYTVSVSLSGGSGRASIASPTTIVKDGDTYTATITWSSSNYDKMTVDGVDYAPVNDGGNSTFEIPVTLDEDIAVSAETVAMSTPHTIDYTLHFDSSTMKEKSGDDASGGSLRERLQAPRPTSTTPIWAAAGSRRGRFSLNTPSTSLSTSSKAACGLSAFRTGSASSWCRKMRRYLMG
ncbi:MAG: hypothetical protein ACLUSU_10905 [Collinsella sp.]